MKRLLVLLSIVVIGLAAPARAWCEATCTQPVADQKSHCPAHSHQSGTNVSAADQDQCPAIDSARTLSPARLDSASSQMVPAALAFLHLDTASPSDHRATARLHVGSATPSRSLPLRL